MNWDNIKKELNEMQTSEIERLNDAHTTQNQHLRNLIAIHQQQDECESGFTAGNAPENLAKMLKDSETVMDTLQAIDSSMQSCPASLKTQIQVQIAREAIFKKMLEQTEQTQTNGNSEDTSLDVMNKQENATSPTRSLTTLSPAVTTHARSPMPRSSEATSRAHSPAPLERV